MAVTPHLSNKQINRAGRKLCRWLFEGLPLDEEEVDGAAMVVWQFRAMHGGALTKVAAGLRYYASKHSAAGAPLIVGQRLKRLPTIIDKLRRHPNMALTTMQDVGGCRAVLPTQTAADALATDLNRQRRWEIVRSYDYVRQPKESGYRALHLITRKDGRLIEIQLRTPSQHAWATLIDSADRSGEFSQYGHLKSSEAPADLLQYYRLGADLLEAHENGEDLDQELLAEFRRLNQVIEQYRTRRG